MRATEPPTCVDSAFRYAYGAMHVSSFVTKAKAARAIRLVLVLFPYHNAIGMKFQGVARWSGTIP